MSLPFSPPPLSDAEQIEALRKQLQWATLKIQVLEEQLRLERIKKYGPKSEKLSVGQLELLEGEPGVCADEVEAESEREPMAATPPASPEQNGASNTRRRRAHPGRQQLPAGLRRVQRVIPCTAEQCACPACGKETAVIGYEESEHLDVEPASYFVLVTKREKRACRCCGNGVQAAPLAARIIEKGLVSDRVVIDTLVSKYGDHLPLYRQSLILERETGISISRATMDGWIMHVGETVMPIVSTIRRDLLRDGYIQADETPVPVQMHDGRGKNHHAWLWQYGRPGGSTVFDFQLGRSREGPKKFLDNFTGILQTDGYGAYERVGGTNVVHAACWAHARRKVFEAMKLHPDDRTATRLVARIDELFAVDAEARQAGWSSAERDRLRQERSRPLLATLRGALEQARAATLPASALGRAVNYTLSLWPKLTRFLDHPELELSNNLAENSMRPLVLGRKNWIHVGSEQAGPKVAAILSIFESCRRLGVPIREYLSSVLPGLANRSVQNLAALTPAAWMAARR